jgi:hypothetical protein
MDKTAALSKIIPDLQIIFNFSHQNAERRVRCGCCAPAPPSSVRNLRRFIIRSPRRRSWRSRPCLLRPGTM